MTHTLKQVISAWLGRIWLSFRRIFTYKGRATRAEFWGFYLLYTLYCFVPMALNTLADHLSGETLYYLGGSYPDGSIIISGCLSAVTMIFQLTLLSLTVRRLRDAGRSVYWVAPYLGMILVTYLIAQFTPPPIETIDPILLGGADEPTVITIHTIPVGTIVSQMITTLLLIWILILCLRKSSPTPAEPDA